MFCQPRDLNLGISNTCLLCLALPSLQGWATLQWITSAPNCSQYSGELRTVTETSHMVTDITTKNMFYSRSNNFGLFRLKNPQAKIIFRQLADDVERFWSEGETNWSLSSVFLKCFWEKKSRNVVWNEEESSNEWIEIRRKLEFTLVRTRGIYSQLCLIKLGTSAAT